MASYMDGEIYRDFVIEAGEILEKLNEELVQLDQHPGDAEILNSIFRGFHTIKGGASFLGIESIVALCHGAEEIFSLCRSGELTIDAAGIDIVLRAADSLAAAFNALRNEATPDPAAPELLNDLRVYASRARQRQQNVTPATKQGDAAPASVVAAGKPASPPMVTEAPVRSGLSETAATPSTEAISDDEFEALLDHIHGKGKVIGKAAASAPIATQPVSPVLIDAQTGKVPAAAGSGTTEKPVRQPETTLRIETRRLDEIMNLVGELVLARNRLVSIEALARDEKSVKAIDDIDLLISDLQVSVMKSRMQPIQKIFARFPRVVRDLARSLGKEVTLEISGEETDLEKNMVESLADPLVHLVRNAIDHGIESAAERERAGKPRHGTLILSAHQEGDRVVVTISDDGAGIDAERLREAAVRKQLMDINTAARLSEQECLELMFQPGMTTRLEASDISGRGVGMDVVRTKIEQLGGVAEVISTRGVGTTIVIRLPLTLAILPTLMIGLNNQVFAFPLSCIVEIINVNLNASRKVDGQAVIIVRGKPLPLFFLGHWLLRDPEYCPAGQAQVVITRVGLRHIAFVVDSLIGQEEVVIKPLGALVNGTKGLAGATITGDGRVALILDVPELLSAYANGTRARSRTA